jgi:hypothetical protein
VLKLARISVYILCLMRFQYDGLKALGYLPYTVVWPSALSRGHLRDVQYGDLKVPGCLPYPLMRPFGLEIT